MTGTWYFNHKPEDKKFFQFKLADKVDGTLHFLKPGEDFDLSKDMRSGFEIQVDYDRREITSGVGQEKVISMEALDAVDSAMLTYFIKQPDVKFLHAVREDGGKEAFVQAKLTAIGQPDENSRGVGVVESQIILYNVNVEPKAEKAGKN